MDEQLRRKCRWFTIEDWILPFLTKMFGGSLEKTTEVAHSKLTPSERLIRPSPKSVAVPITLRVTRLCRNLAPTPASYHQPCQAALPTSCSSPLVSQVTLIDIQSNNKQLANVDGPRLPVEIWLEILKLVDRTRTTLALCHTSRMLRALACPFFKLGSAPAQNPESLETGTISGAENYWNFQTTWTGQHRDTF